MSSQCRHFFTFFRTTPGAPDFPNVVGSLPTGSSPPLQDVYTIPADYDTIGFKRNSEATPALSNIDLRYSRSFRIKERFNLEAFAEIQNLFNTNGIIGYSDTSVDTDPFTGVMIGPLPNFKTQNQSVGQESRQLQLGFRFTF